MPRAVTLSLPPGKSVIGFITRGSHRAFATIASRDSNHSKVEVSGRDLDAVKFRVNQGTLYLLSARVPDELPDAVKKQVLEKFGVVATRTEMVIHGD